MRRIWAFEIAAAFVGYINVATAQVPIPGQPGQFAAGVGLGGSFLQPTSFAATGSIQGLPVVASGKVHFMPGPAISIFGAYSFNDHFALAGQVGYAYSRLDRFEGDLTVFPIGSFGSSRLKGDQESVNVFFDGLVTPFGRNRPFIPVFGGGIGFVSSKVTLKSATVFGSPLSIGSESTSTRLAGNLFAAMEYRIGSQDVLAIGYQFIVTDASSLGSGGGLKARTGSQLSHVLGVYMEHHF
jgi:hypothetical protein